MSIVGYSTGTTDPAFNWSCNTFKKIGGKATLADIKVDGNAFIASSIDFLDSNGGANIVNDPDWGEVYEQYIFIPGDYTMDGNDGWFFADDMNGEYHKEGRVIEFGEGFIVNCASGEDGNDFTFSGEVSQATLPVEIGPNFNWSGNPNPVEKTLADIAVDGNSFIASSIDFLDSNGGANIVNDPDWGEVYEQYIFIPGDYTMDGNDGWFFADDMNGEYHKEARKIPAGAGFCINCASGEDGNIVELPAAL